VTVVGRQRKFLNAWIEEWKQQFQRVSRAIDQDAVPQAVPQSQVRELGLEGTWPHCIFGALPF